MDGENLFMLENSNFVKGYHIKNQNSTGFDLIRFVLAFTSLYDIIDSTVWFRFSLVFSVWFIFPVQFDSVFLFQTYKTETEPNQIFFKIF